MRITGLPPEALPYARRLLPFLENFADRSLGRWTADEIMDRLSRAIMQAWVIGNWQAVAVTEVGPDHVGIVFCAGSRREDWAVALDDEMRAWARHLGKRHLVITARPGWSKLANARGYREIHREMMVEV